MKSNNKILELINKNASVNEICNITGLSHKQLFYRMNMLKIKGYDFEKKYYYSGDIVYNLLKGFNKDTENEKTIYTSSKDTEFKALLISDIHLGSIDERPELLFEIYNYAIKEGINIIINAGDLVDGTFGGIKNIKDIDKQIEHLLKCYPFDKNILNFICLGNHDYSCLEKKGMDINKILDNKRHDLVSLGYGQGCINIKNDSILICHPKTETNLKDRLTFEKGLVLSGHYHNSKNIVNGNLVNLHLPTLSNMNDDISYPSILKMIVDFTNGIFNIGTFEQLIFIDNKLYKVSESQYDLFKGKDTSKTFIYNEEERKTLSKNEIDNILGVSNNSVIKKENTKTLRLTQTEKFRQRYNIEKK